MLYGLSSFAFLIIYYLFPYRKKLVKKNISLSFPEYSKKEVNTLTRKFYQHFCDTFIETIAGPFMKEDELIKRYKLINPEICNDLHKKGKSIALIMGHYGNWEWSGIMQKSLDHKILAIYKPLHNKLFDKFFKDSRERFGLETVPMDKIFRKLSEYQKRNIPSLTYFLADQRPRWAQIQHWTTFLNQDTPVVLGPEKISTKLDMALVFFIIKPVKRGYYEIEFKLLFEDPKSTQAYEITETYHKILERIIAEKPEYWLWTHNRWKHEKEKYIPKANPLG
jgi:Kdo2-lipid IVA lauroyltransferase/acyltransferase